jgi:hypothetical protein
MKSNCNYLSRWIANLGVVPLLRLWALRLLPDFFNLLARLVFVTRVRETISSLLQPALSFQWSYNIMKSRTLVKFFVLFIGLTPLLEGYSVEKSTIYINKGEATSINFRPNWTFHNGTPELLKARLSQNSQKLLLKGLQKGSGFITIFNQGQIQSSHKIQIDAPIEKKFQLAFFLQQQNLDHIILGHNIYKLNRPVSEKSVLKTLQKFLNSKSDYKIIGELSEELKKSITGEIYKDFFNNHWDNIQCLSEGISFICKHPYKSKHVEDLQNFYKEKYGVQFIEKADSKKYQSFKIKLKLFQIESKDDLNFSNDFDQIGINPEQLFQKNFQSLYRDKIIQANQKGLFLSVISEPESILILNEKNVMKIGGELPIQSTNSNNVSITEWKFFGLNIQLQLTSTEPKYFLKYKIDISQPLSEGAISLNSNQSSTFININQRLQIFEFKIISASDKSSSIPLLKSIPILNNLFQTKIKGSLYKKIYGIISLEALDG